LSSDYPVLEQKTEQSSSGHRSADTFRILLLIAAIVLPPVVMIPVQIHLAESKYFAVGLSDIAPVLLPVTLAFMLAGVLLALAINSLLSISARRLLIVACTGLAILVWLQGQIMLWDYGVLDGRDIIDSSWSIPMIVDSLIWASVLLAVFLARHWLVRFVTPICSLLLLIQLIPVALALINYSPPSALHRFSFSEQEKFSYSRQQNVILIVLDAYQTDVFQDLIDTDHQWREEFDGFTYFRNALAGYSKTYPSLALMLTGQWYENQEPIQDFLSTAFDEQSLTGDLLDEGWQVDLFPHLKRLLPISPGLASNVESVISCESRRSEAGLLLDLGWFRVSPHWVKSFWLNDYHWRLKGIMSDSCRSEGSRDSTGQYRSGPSAEHHPALAFIKGMEGESDVSLNVPAFKLYHLLIPHAPFHLDADLQVRRLEGVEQGYRRQSLAALEVIKRFLLRLREIGSYDNSLIVIVSDHGGGEYVSAARAEGLPAELQARIVDNADIPGTHLVSGLPLILIKPAGFGGRLEISDAPVSLSDIARTIADHVGLEADFPGENIFQIEVEQQRTRRYLHYQFGGWHGDYLPGMIEYLVDGFSWSAGSWHPTGRVLVSPEVSNEARSARLSIGREVRFMPDSPYTGFLVEGWSPPDANGLVWSRTDKASMEIVLDEPVASGLTARFDFLPYTGPGLIESPEIRLSVNDAVDHHWVTTGQRGWHEVHIPAELSMDAASLRFDFEFPDAASPLELGISSDARRLGIGLYRIKLEHTIDGGSK